jgi:uncharacterized membrane protein YbhN (UPF0104 family)
VDSVRAFLDALEAFADRLTAVEWPLLLAAVALTLLNLALRSRAWQQILRAAFPGEPIRYGTAFGGYCAGVGVNAIIPARIGDLVKVYFVKHAAPRTSYATLAATLVTETAFDFVVASILLVWALQAGVLPGVRLPDIPAFDLSLAFRHPFIALAIVGALVILGLLAAHRVRAFWRKFGRGLAILATPGRYLRSVASYQALGWCCRIGAGYLFLGAFSVPATLENALIVQVAGSLGGLFPGTPGGLGPKQALLVVMLAGSAGRTDILAFSAGMEVTLVVTTAVLGVACMAVMLRSLRFRAAIAQARARRADGAESA